MCKYYLILIKKLIKILYILYIINIIYYIYYIYIIKSSSDSNNDGSSSTRTIIINKQFIAENEGNMNVNGLDIRENINLENGQMSIEVPIGQVDPNAPNEALRAWWNPVDWVCWVEDKISSAANTVFDTVSSVFGVKKHDAEYLLLTKTGQVLRGDFDCILEGIELGLFENIRNNNGFQFWHCNEDVLNRRMRILNNQTMKNSTDPDIIAKREHTRNT